MESNTRFLKIKDKVILLIPYIIILIASILGTYIYFYDGLNVGDDFYFHLPNILDQYTSIVNGNGLNAISGNLAMGLGVGNRLFYSPLSHLMVVIISLFYSLFGGSIFAAFKTVVILSVFISGIFMYRFALHFTNNNKIAAIIAALVFVLYPYRLFNALCRLAFAEAFSIMFLPLFFMGLYDIVHINDDKEISVMPFIEVILGGALLYLSHNLTALYMFIIGIIYLLVNIKQIIKLIKNPKYLTYCGVGVLLLIGISSIALFSQLELMGTGLYNLTHTERMWTSLQQVTGRLNEEWNYSGFLNFLWLSNALPEITLSNFILGMIMYLVACAVFVIIDKALMETKTFKNKHLHLIVSGIALFVLISLISFRIESLLGVIIFYIIYVYIYFNKDKQIEEQKEEKIYQNKLFWFSLVSIFFAIYMMENATLWNIMPQFMLNIQFPWRLWSVVQIFVSIIAGLLVYYFRNKDVSKYVMASLVGFLLVTSMPLIEKRIVHEKFGGNWRLEIDESYLDEGTALGFNKEYIPQVFLDSDYKSEYSNSLYYSIRYKIPYNFHNYEDYQYSPVVLSGNGEIVVNECFAPNYDMNINVSQDSLIQMPLIYYPGYQIKMKNIETGKVIEVEGDNVDGLVAFNISEGNYKVTTDYVGTTLRKTSKVFFYISVVATGTILVYGLFFEKRKKDKNIQSN